MEQGPVKPTPGDSADQVVWAFLSQKKDVRKNPTKWLQLLADPDPENESFLRNLIAKLRKARAFRDTCILFITPAPEGRAELLPGLGPIGNTLYHLDPRTKLHGIRLLRSRFRNTETRRIWMVVATELLFIILALGLVTFGNYVAARTSGLPWSSWLSYALSLLALYAGNSVGLKGLNGPEAPKLQGEQLAKYKLPSHLTARLGELLGKRTRLALLVDDLHQVPSNELVFLRNLFSETPPKEVLELRERAQLLIVSRDPTCQTPLVAGADRFEMPQQQNQTSIEEAKRRADMDRQLERQATALLAEYGNSKPGGWGALELLAVCLADPLESRSRQDWQNVLSVQEGSVFARHLEATGLTLMGGPIELLGGLAGSALFHLDGKSYHRERAMSSALRRVMEREYPACIGKAHLLWFAYYQSTGTAGADWIYRHTLEAARLMDADSIRLVGLEQLLVPLSKAARIWRENGEVLQSAQALESGAKILPLGGGPGVARLIEDFAGEWALLYAAAGMPATTDSADGAGDLNVLRSSQAWAVHAKNLDDLRLSPSAGSLDDTRLSPELQNLNRRAETDRQRQELGGDRWIYNNPAFKPPGEAEPRFADPSEFALREFHARQARAAASLTAFQTVMEAFRRRLSQVRPAEDQLGLLAAWLLGRALYTSVLYDWWRDRSAEFGASPTADAGYGNLCDTVWPMCLEPAGDPEVALPDQIKSALEQCLTLANLLSLRFLAVDATARLAALMNRKPSIFQVAGEKWWKPWDEIFEATIGLCEKLGWAHYEASIRWDRFNVFRKLDIRSSAMDAFRFYELVRGFPAWAVARWNREILGSFGGASLGHPNLELRLAEMYEDWARLVSIVDIARLEPAGIEKPLSVGQGGIDAFTRAAKSYHHGNHSSKAKGALSQAAHLVKQSYGELDPPPDAASAVERNLLFRFYSACRLLHDEAENKELPNPTAEQLWAMMRPGDQEITHALADVLLGEYDLLGGPWLQEPGEKVVDRVNPSAELIFQQQPVSVPATLFEFRLRLLVGWLAGDSYSKPDDVRQVAAGKLRPFCRIENCIFTLAAAGLSIPDIPDLDALMVALLQLVHSYAVNDVPNDEEERHALRWLMRYEPMTRRWRDLYLEVCRELESLLEREARQLAGAHEASIMEIALQIQSYLDPLEDPELRRAYYEHTDLTMQKLEGWKTLFAEAQQTLSRGEIQGCWSLIKDELTWDDLAVVTIPQLQLMDLALQCASADSTLREHVAILRRRRNHLLDRYARRFLQTVSGKDEKALVKRIGRRVSDLLASANEPPPVEFRSTTAS